MRISSNFGYFMVNEAQGIKEPKRLMGSTRPNKVSLIRT